VSGDSYAARLLDPSTAMYRGNSKTDESARFMFNYLNNGEYFDPYTLNIYGGDYGGTNGKFGSDSNMPMVTYGEMLLIVAEVDARASVSAGVTSYNNYRALLDTGYSIGISNSGYDSETFNYDPYVDADFNAGGMENPDNITAADALLREIYQERYIYFIGSYEAYSDFGRTNNKAGIQLKPSFSNTPERFIYPQVEINSNPNTPSPVPSIFVKTPVHL
jgi:starch-binding outer membrane protein, SusD/RagB family